MPCYHPITAYKPGSTGFKGKLTFKEYPDSGPQVELPCGRCIGCRIKRTEDWATRCMHEAHMHRNNAFITLTYDEKHWNPSLNYKDFKNFTKRARDAGKKFRYFAAGEYGELEHRPHWHALIFGESFGEWKQIGEKLWRSEELESLWKHGFSSLGQVNWQTASYVASYCIKKVTGEKAEQHYTRLNPFTGEIIKVEPEMARMSLKPAIGKTFYEKYHHEIHIARDAVVKDNGKTCRPPRYYDKLLEIKNKKQMIEIQTNRETEGIKRQADNTTERLIVRENVTKARLAQKRKKL